LELLRILSYFKENRHRGSLFEIFTQITQRDFFITMSSGKQMRKIGAALLTITLVNSHSMAGAGSEDLADVQPATATPIKHLVVIFGENVSFDHYFGTYPNALNPPGEPSFIARPDTPGVNGLTRTLREHNPNFLNVKVNREDAANPFRLSRSEAATADQDHDYTAEQEAFHAGLLDSFPRYTGIPGSPAAKSLAANMPGGPPQYQHQTKGLVMGYYDGNTVTAYWNYAQRFALNDNSYGSTFGPSTPGAHELISGQTNGVIDHVNAGNTVVEGGDHTLTEVGDGDPVGDACSATTGPLLQLSSNNIGVMLAERNITWGWFEGGFDLTQVNANGTTGCLRSTFSQITRVLVPDYIPHHQPFQFYQATENLAHTRPTSILMIGHNGDAGRHQYDTSDFFAAVRANNFPAVSFLKAPAYQDGHAGYSDPLDEQAFIVQVINFLQQQPDWKSTAVILAYDDSDGWYDHQMGPIVNQSRSRADALTGREECGDGATALPGPLTDHAQGRCGYGPRLPLLVISPYAKRNYVDHTLTDQTSILRFIEDNWLQGKRVGQGSFDEIAGSLAGMFDFDRPQPEKYILDGSTGNVVNQ
jgi:phospholipase C